MATNNFERLFEEENERFEERQRSPEVSSIDNNLWKSMGIIRFIGQIFDLFIPRADFMAPRSTSSTKGRHHSAPSQGLANNPQDIQPRSPSSDKDPRKD